MGKVLGYLLVIFGAIVLGSPSLGFEIPLLEGFIVPIVGFLLIFFGLYNFSKQPRYPR